MPARRICQSSPVVRYTQAALILDHIARLVDEPDVTRAHWAQFMDSSVDALSLVRLDGHRRAAYNAFKLYAMTPVARRSVEFPRSLSALASTDAHTSGQLLWNRSRSDKRLSIVLKNIPFARARCASTGLMKGAQKRSYCASGWQRFRYVAMPLRSPTVLFLTVTSFIAAFQLFDLVIILTGCATGVAPGGPGGTTRAIVLFLY